MNKVGFARCTRFPVGVLVTLLLVACTSSTREAEFPIENALEVVDSAPPKTAVPESVSNALLGGKNEVVAAVPRFDVSVHQVNAKDFFLGLIDGTGTNVVVHPGVEGKLSLNLKDVSVREVLEVARDVYGYEFKERNGIFTIYPLEFRTELFPINYLDVRRVGVSDISVPVGRLDSGSSNSNNGSNGSGNSGGQTQNPNLLGMFGDGKSGNGSSIAAGSHIQTLSKTDFWNSLRETLVAIIGGESDQRRVMISPQAGMVIVKALPGELFAVREFLERSEITVKRQVIIEAKILEVRLSDEFAAGINWDAISGQLLLGRNVTEFEAPNTITTAAESGEIFASLLKVNDISQLLDLLEEQGNVQVLSSPRISTVNNQKAVIRVGTDEFFVTGLSSNTVSNASSTTNTPNIDLSSFFSGIALDVTPQIAASGDIVLHIHPVVSSVKDQEKNLTLGDQKFSLPLAVRDIREADSIVRAESGQVVVLGGLMQEQLLEVDGKTPLLGDVPVVRGMFNRREYRKVKTELVIMLKPTVVDPSTYANDVNASRERVKALGGEYRDMFKKE
ncbi:pilus (MSHA type) biogenesis protein MshL [Simiduia agarivorans]|uniref:MSHA biogenesis protein MshL n=1 Tax=Simiduia agarivorans (strain DSM 21679 / JCM 13881 / BCRC 17597 / SA1) TaxID=1117647 RepID=K4KJ90_SIMAS|nr:pilus (MSHA type) biogenesis protein MshL [Simiduia agarivorans]AFU98058.1 MSHA biogenesis protein MshL [Simiduia agarivorans SA1 = DSM 21679]